MSNDSSPKDTSARCYFNDGNFTALKNPLYVIPERTDDTFLFAAMKTFYRFEDPLDFNMGAI
jgi:hypothetical protein